MKKCQFCGVQALYEVTQIDKEESKLIPMCQNCFSVYAEHNLKKGIDPKAVNDFVSNIMKIVDDVLDTSSKIKKCSNCGLTLNRLMRNGRIGCVKCYDIFFDELKSIIQNAHKIDLDISKHYGKVPTNRCIDNEVEETDNMILIKLQYKMQKAIDVEDYESAAELRDKIKELSEDLNN